MKNEKSKNAKESSKSEKIVSFIVIIIFSLSLIFLAFQKFVSVDLNKKESQVITARILAQDEENHSIAYSISPFSYLDDEIISDTAYNVNDIYEVYNGD